MRSSDNEVARVLAGTRAGALRTEGSHASVLAGWVALAVILVVGAFVASATPARAADESPSPSVSASPSPTTTPEPEPPATPTEVTLDGTQFATLATGVGLLVFVGGFLLVAEFRK